MLSAHYPTARIFIKCPALGSNDDESPIKIQGELETKKSVRFALIRPAVMALEPSWSGESKAGLANGPFNKDYPLRRRWFWEVS